MKFKFNIFSSLFSGENKLKVKPHTEAGDYYENVSKKYSLLAVISVALAVAVILVGFSFNKGMFTYQNLFYMFKDIDLAGAEGERTDKALTYPDGEDQSFVLYKNGLAVGDDNVLSIFTPSGKQSMTDNFSMKNTRIEGSDGYVMVYEAGGYNFSLYNSFAKLYSSRAHMPIQLARVSDSGAFAIVSASDTHASLVRLYDRNFNVKSEYGREDRVSCVAISRDGRQIAISSVGVSDGEYVSKVARYDVGKDKASFEVSFAGAFILDCSFADNGNLTLMLNNGVKMLSSDGKTVSKFDFEGRVPHRYDISDGECAVAFCKDSISGEYGVVHINEKGRISPERTANVKLEQIKLGRDCIYILGRDKIVRFDHASNNGAVLEYNCTGKVLIPCDEGGFLLCSSLRADYFDF